MKKTFFLTVTLTCIFTVNIFSQADLPAGLSLKTKTCKNFSFVFSTEKLSDLKNYPVSDIGNLKRKLLYDAENIPRNLNDSNKINKSADNPKKKSVLLGMGLSALLPGAGEFYGGNILKAAIFLGVEVIGWGAYIYFTKKGDRETNDFQNYANTYWSVRTYGAWLVSQGFQGAGGINPNEPDLETLRSEIMVCEEQNFSHTLPDYGTQQFYELIGKYQNFQAGWTNLAHVPTKDPGPYNYETYHDPVFTNYAYSRQAANNNYYYGTTGVIVVVANHVLSIADAAWTVAMFNKKIGMQTGFEIRQEISPYTFNIENVPVFKMKVTF